MDREKLVAAFVKDDMLKMDIETMENIVQNILLKEYSNFNDEELIKTIKEYAPYLLDEDDEE
jgi:hypothetical protein